jgi:hypothetical protein
MVRVDPDGVTLFWALKRLIDAQDLPDETLFEVLRELSRLRSCDRLKRMAEGILCLVWPEVHIIMLDRTEYERLVCTRNYRESAKYYFAMWAERLESGKRLEVDSAVPDALCDVFQQTLADWRSDARTG